MCGSTPPPRGLKALTKAGSDRIGSTPVIPSLTFLHLEKLKYRSWCYPVRSWFCWRLCLTTVYDFRSPMKNVVPGALKRYFSSWPGAPNDSLLLHTLKTLFSLSLSWSLSLQWIIILHPTLNSASHAKATICNVDFQRNKALQYCCDIILNSSNIVPTLQRRFALLIIERCESSRATAPYLDHFHFEGGGIWVISEKNILQTDFEGKNVARKIANTVFIRISAQPRISAHLE